MPDDSSIVSLHEITAQTVRAICALKVKPEQEQFVASNAVSIAQAYFEPKAWFRGVYAGETPVGFLMLFDDPEKPEYFLWRFMIAAPYQHSGYGRKALELLVEYVRTRPGAMELLVSYEPGEGGPKEFYLKFGFVETGRVIEEEPILSLSLR
jgi:diamine N-acetyltransferase